MGQTHYIIRGGIEGWERLRILSRVMRPTTMSLLGRVGVHPGMRCLEVAFGSGDVAFDLAAIVGSRGRVVATDVDHVKLERTTREAQERGVRNVEFRLSDILADEPEHGFDLVHARFLLTHLPDPAKALMRMRQALRPGGVVVIEDVDFNGYFCYPDFEAHRRYVELYIRTVQRRGGDPCIGPRLPSLLENAGFEEIGMNVVQPAGTEGEVKLISPITMENIVDAVIAEGFASRDEAKELTAQLYEFARRPGTVGAMPRVVETWGYVGQVGQA
ncbi:class I SAM-dependent methyltransferase [Edaphobacter bradus]|uniref:class I SAM-dependent methyltransferase n=1 Tax=Edaphobacter bradus TaxID=2259016 RepID=UPI0021DFA176|nr:class I SAM-dependent methyltransferase [Edaphobacter bradus]